MDNQEVLMDYSSLMVLVGLFLAVVFVLMLEVFLSCSLDSDAPLSDLLLAMDFALFLFQLPFNRAGICKDVHGYKLIHVFLKPANHLGQELRQDYTILGL